MEPTYRLQLVFIASLGILALVLLGVALLLALPRPKYDLVGPVEAYPTSDQPYPIQAEKGYFLVNTGQEILALDPSTPRAVGVSCRVYWDADHGWFKEPCQGSVFNLRGEFLDGPPSRPLRRYPVRVEDQNIWVSTNTID